MLLKAESSLPYQNRGQCTNAYQRRNLIHSRDKSAPENKHVLSVLYAEYCWAKVTLSGKDEFSHFLSKGEWGEKFTT